MIRIQSPVRSLVALAAAAFVAAPVWAESVENPVFKTWASQKKGTVVTSKMNTVAGAIKSDASLINTLVELTDDVATIEMVTIVTSNGMEFKAPATKIEVKKMIELPAGKTKADFDKPEGLVDQGTETVKVGGVEYKTKWMKIKTTMSGVEIEAKTWTSDDVPNMLVKMESKGKVMGIESSTTMELVSVKKP